MIWYLMTVVMVTRLTIVGYISGKIFPYQFIDIARTASDNLNTLSLKHILCTLAHIASKHHGHTHLLENRRNAALAAAALRRGHLA